MADPYGDNQQLAARVREERERLGLSYRALAAAMAEQGCKIDQSALQRIEKGTAPGKPPPKIGVDELLAFCRVFNTTPDDLLTSGDERLKRDLSRRAAAHTSALDAMAASFERLVLSCRDFVQVAHRGDDDDQTAESLSYLHGHRRRAENAIHDRLSQWGPGVVEAVRQLEGHAHMLGNEIVNEQYRRSHPDEPPILYPELFNRDGTPYQGSPPDWASLPELADAIDRHVDGEEGRVR